ncbi:uncharacterized protein LOC115655129 isoform X1 [Gopherus evgoodei]|uniref:uncharacterized protein LOC115655129 isoform X1 n=1 Tax=Gopherus evgoodei TaxID=1825980 RepID=UPI0011CF8568|nr:uncharacterized protein LOC115655129 isoform X1 [Gopherus evgoodei]
MLFIWAWLYVVLQEQAFSAAADPVSVPPGSSGRSNWCNEHNTIHRQLDAIEEAQLSSCQPSPQHQFLGLFPPGNPSTTEITMSFHPTWAAANLNQVSLLPYQSTDTQDFCLTENLQDQTTSPLEQMKSLTTSSSPWSSSGTLAPRAAFLEPGLCFRAHFRNLPRPCSSF